MQSVTALAVDLGSSSGRVIAGTLADGQITETEVHRFPHEAQFRDGGWSWDLDFIHREIITGLHKAIQRFPDAVSVSVDTWGVDFVLLDADDQRLEPHRTYRDERTLRTHQAFRARLDDAELWNATGIAPATINSANQLFALTQEHPDVVDKVQTVLFLPDYFTFLLSGVKGWSRSIASTSALCRPGAHEFNDEVFNRLGIPRQWVGQVTTELTAAAACVVPGLEQLTVVRGGAHDTACAVHTLPRAQHDSYFLSCGSWSVLGVLRDEPLLSDKALELGLTNEARTDHGLRPLLNITGLWILQEAQRQWRATGRIHDIGLLVQQAGAIESPGYVIDVDEPQFAQPGDMLGRIRDAIGRQGVTLEIDDEALVTRVILDSLAHRYAQGVQALTELTGQPATSLTMFGGGARNELLVRLTAEALGVPVLLGPTEASSLGSLAAQLEVMGHLQPTDRDRVLAASSPPGTGV